MDLPSFPDLPGDSAPSHPDTAQVFPSAPLSASRFALPDGTPLKLTMSRKVRYVSLTGNLGVSTPDDAFVLLYVASPLFNPRERWTAPVPVDEGQEDPGLSRTDPDYFTTLRLRIEEWSDTLPHTQIEDLYLLAIGLWRDEHLTMPLTVPGSEEPASGQKKSPESEPTGPSSLPASAPPET